LDLKGNGSWRKLHNNEIHSLYSSPNIIRLIKSRGGEVGGTVSTHAGGERCLKGFVGRPEGKRQTGKTKAYVGG
jgi:hypothetical protein